MYTIEECGKFAYDYGYEQGKAKVSINTDSAANIIIKIADGKQNNIKFRDTEANCPKCNRQMEIYYCEEGTYAVRCTSCETVTLIRAHNPREAAARVGVKEEKQ